MNKAKNKSSNILADTPLINPSDDRLGYGPFSKSLANSIISSPSDECLVFSLFGPWGSGKTTCLNFVVHYLNKLNSKSPENELIVVRFNPWWFSGQGELLTQFFREFSIALGKKEGFKSVVNSIGKILNVASEIPDITGGYVKGGAKVLSNFFDYASRGKAVWQIREEIKKNLRKQDNRIVVLIDDLDRLPLNEIRSVFRVIKAVADFPKTTYILSFDKKVVVGALESEQNLNGEEYLEKIVQVPFDLPLPDRTTIQKLFFEQLDLIITNTSDELFDKTYWANIYFGGIDIFLNTIRNSKRLTNALGVTYSSLENEVNPVDFIALEALRVFQSDVYHLIRNNPSMFTGHNDGRSSRQSDELKAFHNEWISSVDDEYRENVKEIVSRMFPKVKGVLANIGYASSYEAVWRKDLRICSADIFDRYFKLSIPSDEITNTEMKAYLQLTSNVTRFKKLLLDLSKQRRADGTSRAKDFLERIQDYTEKIIPIDDIGNILNALFEVGDKLMISSDRGRAFFDFSNDVRMGRIMFQLLRRLDTQDERYELLKNAITKGNALAFSVGEVTTLGQQHGKYSSSKKSDQDCLVSKKQQEELEKIALKKIEAQVKKNLLHKAPQLGHILYRWIDWAGEKKVQTWVKQFIKRNEKLVEFIMIFYSKSLSQSMDDKVVKENWRLDPKSLEPFVDINLVEKRLVRLKKSKPKWLKGDKKKAVDTFLKEYKARKQGKDPSFDTDDE